MINNFNDFLTNQMTNKKTSIPKSHGSKELMLTILKVKSGFI